MYIYIYKNTCSHTHKPIHQRTSCTDKTNVVDVGVKYIHIYTCVHVNIYANENVHVYIDDELYRQAQSR